MIATRNGDTVIPRADGGVLLASGDTSDLEYAPVISGDGLELFCTRVDPDSLQAAACHPKRGAVTGPFGTPQAVARCFRMLTCDQALNRCTGPFSFPPAHPVAYD